MLPDEMCPECHERPDLTHVFPDRLAKKCSACGHRWLEERVGVAQPKDDGSYTAGGFTVTGTGYVREANATHRPPTDKPV